MGDRANVYIHEEDRPGVYVYTHYYGTELPQKVKAALETDRAKDRLTDSMHLTRILIEELTVNERDSSTGWGVGTQAGDGEDRIVDVQVSYFKPPVVTLKGYGYTWDRLPSDPYNVCESCGQTLPD